MTTTLIFTGGAGPGITQAATASALHLASAGFRTLLLSAGPSHGAGSLLGAPLNAAPAEIADRLDALAIDISAELTNTWNAARATVSGPAAQISGDDLPIVPGSDTMLGMLKLRELSPGYERIVLDAGPHDGLLRALALPDGLRWMVRLLFGLDRGPGRSPGSVGRALLPTSFLPTDVVSGVQDFRVQIEDARAALIDPRRTSVRYVLRPDPAGLAEARAAIPALQLHGLSVALIATGPLLPDDVADERIAPLAADQREVVDQAREIWPARPLVPFPAHPSSAGETSLRAVGQHLAAELDTVGRPIAHEHGGRPALVVELPGMPRGALRLTLSGDELVVQIGAYRRHLLLPEGLRGTSSIRATREGDLLIVQRR